MAGTIKAEGSCRSCGAPLGQTEALQLWDGRDYCLHCVEQACPGLAAFARENPKLQELIPFSIRRALWAGICGATRISLLLTFMFLMYALFGVAIGRIALRQLAAGFYGVVGFFGASWFLCALAAIPFALVLHGRRLPRLVQISAGRLLIVPPGEGYVPLEDVRWAGATNWYDRVEGGCWPTKPRIVLFPYRDARRREGWTCGITDETYGRWQAFLSLAQVERQELPFTRLGRWAHERRRALLSLAIAATVFLAATCWWADRDRREAMRRVDAAEAFTNAGRFDEAIAECDEAVRLAPFLAIAYNQRGVVRLHREQLEEAMADFERAIELDSRCANAYSNRASIHVDRGELQQALDDTDKAIRLERRHVAAHNNRGQALVELGRLDEALAELDEALRWAPDQPIILANRGRALTRSGNYEEALRDLNRAIDLNPALHRAWQRRARVFLESGQLDDALHDADECVRLRADYALGWYIRAVILEKLGRSREAADDRAKALRLQPDVAKSY